MYCNSTQKMPQPMGSHRKEILMQINAPKEDGDSENYKGNNHKNDVLSLGPDQIPSYGNKYGYCRYYIS